MYPEHTPEWACTSEWAQRTQVIDDNDHVTIRDTLEENLEPGLDFLLNSAEMNLPRPEDLDEPGESSTAVS